MTQTRTVPAQADIAMKKAGMAILARFGVHGTDVAGMVWAAMLAAGPDLGWRDIESAPKNGSHFLAEVVDLVDEYDAEDRLVARAVPTVSVVIAYHVDWLGGLVEYPYNGRILQDRTYRRWHQLPAQGSPG